MNDPELGDSAPEAEVLQKVLQKHPKTNTSCQASDPTRIETSSPPPARTPGSPRRRGVCFRGWYQAPPPRRRAPVPSRRPVPRGPASPPAPPRRAGNQPGPGRALKGESPRAFPPGGSPRGTDLSGPTAASPAPARAPAAPRSGFGSPGPAGSPARCPGGSWRPHAASLPGHRGRRALFLRSRRSPGVLHRQRARLRGFCAKTGRGGAGWASSHTHNPKLNLRCRHA